MEKDGVRPLAVTLVAYSEIAVKGRKRKIMENVLKQQILRKLTSWDIKTKAFLDQGRIVIPRRIPGDLARMPGIHHMIYAYRLHKLSPRELSEAISSIFPRAHNFAVRVRRADKRYPMKSNELASLIGSMIEGDVNLSKPDVVIHVEIRDSVYVYTSKDVVEGVGGLPYGVEGKAYVKLSGDEGLLASALLVRRGVEVVIAEPLNGLERLAEALPKPVLISRKEFCPVVSGEVEECPTIIPTRPCVPRRTLEKAKLLLNMDVKWKVCGEDREGADNV